MKASIASASALLAVLPGVMSQGFGIMALRSASPIHFGSVHANDYNFWIGKNTTSYCPGEVVTNCPVDPQTNFAGGNVTLSLNVVVPGGQRVFVAPDGQLGYTQAHSGYAPEGSVFTGFTKTNGSQYDTLSFTGGLVACPVGSTEERGYPYQIYGQLPGVVLPTGCLGFTAAAVNSTGPTAWQYV